MDTRAKLTKYQTGVLLATARNGHGVVKQGSDVCDACRSWVSIKKANQSNTVTNPVLPKEKDT